MTPKELKDLRKRAEEAERVFENLAQELRNEEDALRTAKLKPVEVGNCYRVIDGNYMRVLAVEAKGMVQVEQVAAFYGYGHIAFNRTDSDWVRQFSKVKPETYEKVRAKVLKALSLADLSAY